MSAELLLPRGFDRSELSVELCHQLLREAGVAVTPAVTREVGLFCQRPDIADPPPAEQADSLRAVLARGDPPTPGQDGFIEWLVTEHDYDPPVDAETKIDHHKRTSFILVKQGQHIGSVHEPTPGVDGLDVTGKSVHAVDGKPSPVTFDDSIQVTADRRLIANLDGVLERSYDRAAVSDTLEVRDHVDFSTGNLNFHGNVHVRRGVRDCFVVKATGDVAVDGLIEAAKIETGGDLAANGGFAGRERGYARIGGSLNGRYLDNIAATVDKNLHVDREIITYHASQCVFPSIRGGRSMSATTTSKVSPCAA